MPNLTLGAGATPPAWQGRFSADRRRAGS